MTNDAPNHPGLNKNQKSAIQNDIGCCRHQAKTRLCNTNIYKVETRYNARP